jgi:acetyl-CoA synthetase
MSIKISSFTDYLQEHQRSMVEPEKFWSNIANQFYWRKPWKQVLDGSFSDAKIQWFVEGKLNITENIFERNLFTKAKRPALIWEPNSPRETAVEYTYGELYQEVNKFAGVLRNLGVNKGDTVSIYLPMIPELVISMLACARIGAIHSVVYMGSSSRALAERNLNSQAKVLITADGAFQGKNIIPLKDTADVAMAISKGINNVIVVKRTGAEVLMRSKRDFWWHELTKNVEPFVEAVEMDSEDPLFILYSSGATGKPKGIVHTTGGYMVYSAYTFKNIFQFNDDDVFFNTADIGWISGHSYLVYGPLLEGATVVMYEGAANYPKPDRYWKIIEKYNVTHFYTSPTTIRALMAEGEKRVDKYKMKSLKVLGTVGEPINEDAWHWYYNHVGKNRCPIVDTWWQAESGGIMISPIAGITPTKPTYATLPLPGIQPVILDKKGEELKGRNVEGYLCFKQPWPGIARSIWNDELRYQENYFARFQDYFYTGDIIRIDEDGYYRLLGRVDDAIQTSKKVIPTAEVENALCEHPLVTEAAIVAFPHRIKGKGIHAFVVVPEKAEGYDDELRITLKNLVEKLVYPDAKPDGISFVRELPKTRSGKIMRRILHEIVSGAHDFGDTTTLSNPEVINNLIVAYGL